MAIVTGATWLAGLALVAVAVTMAHYRTLVRELRVPKVPIAHGLVALVAIGAAVTALLRGPGVVGWALAPTAILLSSFFVLSNLTSGLPRRTPRISVGRPAADFEAMASDGTRFRLSSARGQRVLLKFYRGYWCSFCDAELQQYERFRRALELDGIRLIAVGPDTVTEAAKMKRERQLGFTVLSDEKMDVAQAYDLGYRGFTAVRGPLRELYIPTTVLIDEDGIVRWIDQAEDFRVRTDLNTVLETIRGSLSRDSVRAPAAGHQAYA